MKKRLPDLAVTLFLFLMAAVVIAPIFLTIFFSLGEGISIYADFYVWRPIYLRSLLNSVIIAVSVSVGTVVISIMAAYVFAKVRFIGRDVLFYLYMIVMLMPFQVTLLPQYIVSKRLSVYDTPCRADTVRDIRAVCGVPAHADNEVSAERAARSGTSRDRLNVSDTAVRHNSAAPSRDSMHVGAVVHGALEFRCRASDTS